MFNVIRNTRKSIDYDKYLEYVAQVNWSQYGSIEKFQSEKYIIPGGTNSTRNAMIKSISTNISADFELEVVIVLELYQVKSYLELSYKGDISYKSNLDSIFSCGGGVTFNELFVDNNRLIHTFLIDNTEEFQISSDTIKFSTHSGI